MSIEGNLGNYFKSEVKASGRKLFAEEKISITGGSDTTILVYVKATPPLKVRLESEGVASKSFTADCACPMGKKAQFCKHVWGALLATEEKFPDFIAAKSSIEKASAHADDAVPDRYAETAKARASEYRKAQYQKQKADLKARKGATERKSAAAGRSFPDEVTEALRYFDGNGFPMEAGPDEAVLAEAKRKLSRVFHPDKGGTHAEITELNRNCEILERFLG
jgi:hypothetical protein